MNISWADMQKLRNVSKDENLKRLLGEMGVDVEPEPDEIITGLSPGKWTCEYDPKPQAGYHWTVRDGNGKLIYCTDSEADAKLFAGAKALLEAVTNDALTTAEQNKAWLQKLGMMDGRLYFRTRRAMRDMGVVFPAC